MRRGNPIPAGKRAQHSFYGGYIQTPEFVIKYKEVSDLQGGAQIYRKATHDNKA